jgi:4,5-dihydroxyphthalate decarboxylase
MAKTKLKTVTRTQGNNRALKEGEIDLPDFELDYEEIPVLVQGFRRMVRELEFDVCEMALTTYICARAHGVKMTALPIFLVRGFHHEAIIHNRNSGLSSPADLKGKEVGVNRGYTVTTGVWARAIIQDEYGVDPGDVTWRPSGDEHVAQYVAPSNVVPLDHGDLEKALVDGEIPAAVGTTSDHADIASLIDEPFEAGRKALKDRGFYPINHCVAVRDDLLAERPEIATQVFDAFAESKRRYVAALKACKIEKLSAYDKVHLAAMEVMDDPLPYGVEPNRHTLEGLVQYAVTQKIIPGPMSMADLFAANILDAVG